MPREARAFPQETGKFLDETAGGKIEPDFAIWDELTEHTLRGGPLGFIDFRQYVGRDFRDGRFSIGFDWKRICHSKLNGLAPK
jgi:hypothetical protein